MGIGVLAQSENLGVKSGWTATTSGSTGAVTTFTGQSLKAADRGIFEPYIDIVTGTSGKLEWSVDGSTYTATLTQGHYDLAALASGLEIGMNAQDGLTHNISFAADNGRPDSIRCTVSTQGVTDKLTLHADAAQSLWPSLGFVSSARHRATPVDTTAVTTGAAIDFAGPWVAYSNAAAAGAVSMVVCLDPRVRPGSADTGRTVPKKLQVTLYSHTADLGTLVSSWQASASETNIQVIGADTSKNPLRGFVIAPPATAPNYKYHLIHFEDVSTGTVDHGYPNLSVAWIGIGDAKKMDSSSTPTHLFLTAGMRFEDRGIWRIVSADYRAKHQPPATRDAAAGYMDQLQRTVGDRQIVYGAHRYTFSGAGDFDATATGADADALATALGADGAAWLFWPTDGSGKMGIHGAETDTGDSVNTRYGYLLSNDLTMQIDPSTSVSSLVVVDIMEALPWRTIAEAQPGEF